MRQDAELASASQLRCRVRRHPQRAPALQSQFCLLASVEIVLQLALNHRVLQKEGPMGR